MKKGRRVLIFLVGIAVCTVSASAGIKTEPSQAEACCCSNPAQNHTDSPDISDDLFKAEFDIWQGQSLPVAAADNTPACEPLTDGTNSLSLCLSALIGFGLFHSAGYIKKMHFGFIPDWYHDGGPGQVGHSHAITPNCIIDVPVYCFIQPDSSDIKAWLPQAFRIKQIVSLWRNSQFTPEAIASRGPPCLS
ncbi:MAG: hypothetical protein JW787_14615 [Sedimentisphaerales bacterium]|nr:hypothetical protein [Sedimentisphaerales bacterium]